jgi:hypothetical protein
MSYDAILRHSHAQRVSAESMRSVARVSRATAAMMTAEAGRMRIAAAGALSEVSALRRPAEDR